MKQTLLTAGTYIILLALFSCGQDQSSNREMFDMLAAYKDKVNVFENPFASGARLVSLDSMIRKAKDFRQNVTLSYYRGGALLEDGQEQESIEQLNKLLAQLDPITHPAYVETVMRYLGMAYLRLGERTNCIHSHSGESCLFPIRGSGIHVDKSPSQSAIGIFEELLKKNPNDLESRWLLNIAYMTIAGYPQQVPSQWLIPGLDEDSSTTVKPFIDVAIGVGVNTNNLAGGTIVEDFNNDGLLDLITSSWSIGEGMHYARNNGNGTFTDISDSSGLSQWTGGLNMMQTDYNNDGYKDIFVLRGGWKRKFGQEPNSLIRNNGDGTFTDVTKEAGILSFNPTQAATWNDFNNDGWIDVFIGNESIVQTNELYPSELYMNNGDGTFTNTAVSSNVNVVDFIKGVTSGDFDNDGWPDIFISTLGNRKVLLRNEGVKDGVVKFRDVTTESGMDVLTTRTFPTWFWDYDNDGWLDLLVCGYEYDGSLASYVAAEALNMQAGKSGVQFLFRNRGDGTFEDVTEKVGLDRQAFAMGSNFGDFDNDGYPDMYLGTGNPLYQSLVPNKMFRNNGGKSFTDITTAARVGNLQKGHGVAIADMDNDGDEDIYIDMGGAYNGDAYPGSLYINPGQNQNNWINLRLEGTKSNRAAIGAKIKVTFNENGVSRSVYRDVNSGGSFGANPLMQHIGIGSATVIESIEIKWPGSNTSQVFKNIQPAALLMIKEGEQQYKRIIPVKTDYTNIKTGLISCGPVK